MVKASAFKTGDGVIVIYFVPFTDNKLFTSTSFLQQYKLDYLNPAFILDFHNLIGNSRRQYEVLYSAWDNVTYHPATVTTWFHPPAEQ